MRPVYRLLLTEHATPGRLAGLGVLGVVGILLGLAVGAAGGVDPERAATALVSAYGLALLVPVTSLVFASSTLGQPNEDGTLVYLWLRPVARWRLVAAAVAAALTMTLPVAVVPLAVAAALTRAGTDVVLGTVAAATLATVAYTGIFTWLGLRVSRALLWGAAYILLWEGFVASAGTTPARFAVRSYARSVLADVGGGPAPDVTFLTVTAVGVPLVAAAAGVALTVGRLTRQDVR